MARPGASSTRMLSRKKTKNEVSKPAEVQGKYVKKETSPLLRSECRAGLTHTWLGPPTRLPAAFHSFWSLCCTLNILLCQSDVCCLKAGKRKKFRLVPSRWFSPPKIT